MAEWPDSESDGFYNPPDDEYVASPWGWVVSIGILVVYVLTIYWLVQEGFTG